MATKKLRAGTCRFCGCRENRACIDAGGPCWWVDARRMFCSHCACATRSQRYILMDILRLVCRKATLAELESWSDLTRARVLDWARAVHLRAGDNLVKVPRIPRAAAALKEIKA